MTGFLAQALLLLAVGVIIAAVVFRSRRLGEALAFVRKLGWGYAIAMVVLAALHLWRDGGL